MKAKNLAICVLSCLSSFSYIPGAFAQNQAEISFTDVSPNHWAYNALEKLVQKYNFKLGYPDGTFKGNRSLTRYEVAALIVQVLEQMPAKKIDKEDTGILKELVSNYSKELDSFKNDVNQKFHNLEDQLDMLEAEHDKGMNEMHNFMDSLPFLISGDIGLRYQLNTKKLGDFSNQIPQTRTSLSIDSKNDNEIGYGVRIISGALNKPGNSWWKFSDFFDRVPLTLDRFFVSYKPGNNFKFTLGRFKDPFSNTEIYYDEEISPQGALQTLSFNDISPFLREINFNAGEIIVNMDPDFGNAYSLNGNVDLKFNLGDFVGLNLKGGYYHYVGEANISKANKNAADKKVDPKILGNTNTNTLNADGSFKNTFAILNGFGKLIFRFSESCPLSVSGDYLYNLGAPADNMAFQAGAKLGSSKEQGNFFIGYNFKYLQKDADISLFVEDQLGGTDFQAHEGVLGVKIFPNTILSATLQAKNGIKVTGDTVYTFRGNFIQSF
jgi:hypothetical protein